MPKLSQLAGALALLTVTLSVPATLHAAAADAVSAAAVNYSEADLPALFQQQIRPFWQQQVSTGQWMSADGVLLPYAYVVPANAHTSILLVQGRTESYLKYQELFWQLAQQGFAVFSLDHRGQGLAVRTLADRHKGDITQFSLYRDDQLAFVRDLVLPKSQGSLTLLAHSMGGAVAAQMLAAEPTLFKRAVLSAAMIAPNATVLFSERDGCALEAALGWSCPDCYAGFVSQPYREQPFADNILTGSATRYQIFRDLYRQEPRLQLGGPTWRWLAQACAVSTQLPLLAKAISTPVLMVQAELEQAVSNSAQQQFCQQLGTACVGTKVFVVKGAKHELLFEADQARGQVLQLILPFLQQGRVPGAEP